MVLERCPQSRYIRSVFPVELGHPLAYYKEVLCFSMALKLQVVLPNWVSTKNLSGVHQPYFNDGSNDIVAVIMVCMRTSAERDAFASPQDSHFSIGGAVRCRPPSPFSGTTSWHITSEQPTSAKPTSAKPWMSRAVYHPTIALSSHQPSASILPRLF